MTRSACFALLLMLLCAPSALGHGVLPPAIDPATLTEHGDPRKALPDSLVTAPVAEEELGTVQPVTVDSGTAPETWCGTETTANDTVDEVVPVTAAHYKLVYAYASDQPNRFATLDDRLQATVSLLQRYLAAQSDGRKALRWDMGTSCGPQYADIQVVQLPGTRASYVPGGAPSFNSVRDDVFTALGGVGAPRNVAIYADGLRGTNGVAGTASLFNDDDSVAFSHDNGGLGAIVFGPQTLPSSPYAEPAVLMHEIAHNLGAVQDSAAHSTLAGHCYDQRDVMCYADGGEKGRVADMVQTCTTISGDVNETFDCGRDDYFNVNPQAGSYLDQHWNVYASEHLGACSDELTASCGLTGAAGDGTRPVNTTAVASASAWHRTWTPTLSGTDTESAVDDYQWQLMAKDGTLGTLHRGQEATVTGTHGTYTWLFTRVRDSAGNWSAWRYDTVWLDTVGPAATVTCPSAWSTGSTAPVCTYTVTDAHSGRASTETQVGSATAAAGPASGSLTATGDAQTIRVRGTDNVGNTGSWTSATARWDRENPTVLLTCPSSRSGGSATCHVTASDAASGMASVTWRVGSGSPTTVSADADLVVSTPGEQTITAVASDVAGRTTQATATSRVSLPPYGADVDFEILEDTPLALSAGSFNFQDPDAGDTLDAVRVDSLPAKGTLLAGGSSAVVGATYAPDALSFVPAADACGPGYASWTVSVRDQMGTYQSSPSRHRVDVGCVDDPSVAVADSATLDEDAGATPIAVRANDTDVDWPEFVVSSADGAHGTTTPIEAGGRVAYRPAGNWCGTDTFTYTLAGGSTAAVDVTVACVDDPAVAVDDTASATEDGPAVTLDVRANDTDVDGGPAETVASRTPSAHGTVAIAHAGADLTYVPDADWCGTDTFTYSLSGASSAAVAVTVACADDAPLAVADTAIVVEDAGATAIAVRANDTDFDGGPRAITGRTNGEHGTVTLGDGDTGLSYVPAHDWCGNDQFAYTLTGGSSAAVAVTVTCVDDPPVAAADAVTLPAGAPASTIDVLANDSDVDGGPRVIAGRTQGVHGQVAVTGNVVTYTPGACGNDSFTYTLNGGSTAKVAVTVGCLPTAVAVPPETRIVKGPKKTVTVRAARLRVPFTLTSSAPDSTFVCRVDKARPAPCKALTKVTFRPGRHTFTATAVDAAGLADPTPAVRTFRIVRKSR